MRKHLTAIGNSLGIIIDKPILELLGIDKDTELDVRTDGTGLIITPIAGTLGKRALTPPPPQKADSTPPEDAALPPPEAPVDLDPAALTPIAGEAPPPPAAAPPPPAAAPPPPAAAPPPPAAAPPAPSADPADSPPQRGNGEIVIRLRDKEVARLPLPEEEVVIGRDKKADIHLDDRSLSRRHAKLERRGAAIWVADLESANGTYVNGELIQTPTRLHADDVIGLGLYRLALEGLAEAAADTPVLSLSGPPGDHRFALVGEQVIIGRAGTCDISIGHKSISRRHMKIILGDGSFVVEDLGSQNGVKVNGQRITGPTKVEVGDQITICEFTMQLDYLREEESASSGSHQKPKKSRTMLIDKSAIVNAAYVDGDLSEMGQSVQAGGKKESERQKGDTGEFRVKKKKRKKA